MIIIKEVPGLDPRELLEAITDIVDPYDPPVVTGHGGFVVSEDVAERFLSAYLIMIGKRPKPTTTRTEPASVDPSKAEPASVDPAKAEPIGAAAPPIPIPIPIPTPPRRAGRRKVA